jgi:methanethiol S-methyltransferase
MKRTSILAYSVACYLVFLAVLLYAVGFLGNFGVAKSIDAQSTTSIPVSLGIDAMLLTLFALQHSIMARPWFKRVWTRVVPEPAERSTYVLFSSLALLALFWWWQPIGLVIWDASGLFLEPVLFVLYGAGLSIVLLSTFLINHFDLFGLRQGYLYFRNRKYVHLEFRTPLFYRYVRHPLYVGWLLSFWSSPVMTAAHLFFAAMTTAYILLAIRFEEKDLVTAHGDRYRHYRETVPMIVPSVRPGADVAGAAPLRLEIPVPSHAPETR